MLLAAVFGAVLTLSFAPAQAWWLAPYCLAGLFLILSGLPAGRASVLGFVFGLANFGTGVWWLWAGLRQYSDAGAPLALCLTLVLAAYLALFPALATGAFGALMARVPEASRQGW